MWPQMHPTRASSAPIPSGPATRLHPPIPASGTGPQAATSWGEIPELGPRWTTAGKAAMSAPSSANQMDGIYTADSSGFFTFSFLVITNQTREIFSYWPIYPVFQLHNTPFRLVQLVQFQVQRLSGLDTASYGPTPIPHPPL